MNAWETKILSWIFALLLRSFNGQVFEKVGLCFFPNYVILFLKLAIMGKCGCFFFRATTLVSARKSHSSGARGLVARCFLFNPEGSCSNPCVCAKCFTSILKQKVLTFSAIWDSPIFGLMRLFRKIFKCPQRGLPWIFYFATVRMLKKQRVPSFRFFDTMRLLKILIFCFRKFSKSPKGPLSFFLKFCNRMDVKKILRAPFCSFRHCEISQTQ